MTEDVTYRFVHNKYVFHKEGIYFSLTLDQIIDMQKLFKEIQDD